MNKLSYEEWMEEIKKLIIDINIKSERLDKEDLKGYWSLGYAPAVMVRALFPEYWKF